MTANDDQPMGQALLSGINDNPALYRDDNKQIVQRRGGWFVTGTDWSGPWATEQAANHARAGDYDAAHAAERAERARP